MASRSRRPRRSHNATASRRRTSAPARPPRTPRPATCTRPRAWETPAPRRRPAPDRRHRQPQQPADQGGPPRAHATLRPPRGTVPPRSRNRRTSAVAHRHVLSTRGSGASGNTPSANRRRMVFGEQRKSAASSASRNTAGNASISRCVVTPAPPSTVLSPAA